jgi:very-short-patch-repair endonuclease
MRDRHGVITRAEALRIVDRHVLDKAISSGAIVRAFPSVYVHADLVEEPAVIDRAAIAYVPRGALSHTTALRGHRVAHRPLDGRRHVTTPPCASVRPTSVLIVHRQRGFAAEPPHVVVRSDLPVVRIERAIVESWPLLVPGERRSPAITAVNAGLTTGARLLKSLGEVHKPAGAAEMRELFGKLVVGCRSELELWGHSHVFDDARLHPVELQYPVRTASGLFRLDRAHLREMVGVELDGAAWHGSQTQRERDVRRDAALAAAGWLIVRFTHARLRDDPNDCRNELAAILDVRRRHRAS